MARHRVTAKLGSKPPKWQLEDFVAQEVEKVQVGDAASVTDFVRGFGSHYIASYVTGNSLYQVRYCAHFELNACKLHCNRKQDRYIVTGPLHCNRTVTRTFRWAAMVRILTPNRDISFANACSPTVGFILPRMQWLAVEAVAA